MRGDSAPVVGATRCGTCPQVVRVLRGTKGLRVEEHGFDHEDLAPCVGGGAPVREVKRAAHPAWSDETTEEKREPNGTSEDRARNRESDGRVSVWGEVR